MKFRSTLVLGGKTATGITVPDEVVAALGSSKRPAVRVTINGHTYRSTIAVMGGVFMLPVSAEIRGIAGVAAGDDVDVDIELDTEERVLDIPADFAAALATDSAAQAFFDGLSYSNKRGFVTAINEAKAAETRQRRIASSVDKLREGRQR
ncbi:MAG TPA: YdeI/OmpD-associated family protein [Ilumatobacteraceae bacterium]|jgi:hypothetical protein